MEQRTLEINVISAKDLKDVNLISKMDVYAVVSLTGPHQIQKSKTPVHRDGGTNPNWNFPIKFTIPASAADHHNSLNLHFKLRCERALGDKDIGEVSVPVNELLQGPATEDKIPKFLTYQVRKPSGKPKGEFHFSYKFGEDKIVQIENKVHEPAPAYPATLAAPPGPSAPYTVPYPAPPPQVVGYGYPPPPPPPQQPYHGYPPYPPPPQGYGYPPPPPPAGYGYPQPGYGYYPQPVQQPQKKNNFGLGLGAGLLGGALGGLLIGDMVSDATGYDAGYDAGFGDAGGF